MSLGEYANLWFVVAEGRAVLAKSVTESRIIENKKSLVPLDKDDLASLKAYSDKLTKEGKLTRYVYPAFGVNFGFPDKQ